MFVNFHKKIQKNKFWKFFALMNHIRNCWNKLKITVHSFFRIFLKNCLSSFYKKIQKIKFWKYFAQNFSLVYDFVMYTNLTPWKVIQVLQLFWLHKRLCATNILFNKVVPSKKVKSSLHVDGESKRGKKILIKAKLAKM